MIEHVYRRAAASPVVSRVIVATDDARIAATVARFGGDVVLTRDDHASGTDRLAEVASTLAAASAIRDVARFVIRGRARFWGAFPLRIRQSS